MGDIQRYLIFLKRSNTESEIADQVNKLSGIGCAQATINRLASGVTKDTSWRTGCAIKELYDMEKARLTLKQ